MLTLPLYLLSARLCYGKNNRKRYYRAEYLVAIAYSSVIVIIYRWLVSLTYLISNGFSNRMGSFMPIATAIALFVCLRKMMGFSIAKTAWRSLLTVVLYYAFLVFIVFVALFIGVVVFNHFGQ
jgi:ABC-type transport system involved in multi-copper enzyme maturation permease subunit